MQRFEHTDFVIEILPYVRSKESKLRHVISGSAISFCWQGEGCNNITWLTHLINVNSMYCFPVLSQYWNRRLKNETWNEENIGKVSVMSRIWLFLGWGVLKIQKGSSVPVTSCCSKARYPSFFVLTGVYNSHRQLGEMKAWACSFFLFGVSLPS